jgi:cytochrome c oxidase subunit 2
VSPGRAGNPGAWVLPSPLAATQNDFSDVQAVYLPIAGIVMVVVFAAFAFAVVRYRARPGRAPRPTREHNALEAAIALVLAAIVAVLVTVTFNADAREAKVAGRPAFRVNAIAFKWGWQFTYSGLPGVVDRTTQGRPPVLHVPAGAEVAVRLSTRDTTHAFWIPELRYKSDAWPGVAQTFALSFPEGDHLSGRCAQYCGLHHSDMVFTVQALGRDGFAAWVARARGRRPGP